MSRLRRSTEAQLRQLAEQNEQLRAQNDVLRENEKRLEAFMYNSPAVAWAKDEVGRYVYLSRTFEEHHGVRLEDWRGKTDFELRPPEIAEEQQKYDLAVLTSGQAVEAVEATLDSDGVRCYWWSSRFPFHDAAGRRYVGGLSMALTERKLGDLMAGRLREAVTEAERNRAQLEAVFQAMNDGVVISDMDGNFILVNEAEARVSGFKSAEDMKRTRSYFGEVYEIAYPDGRLVPFDEWPIARVFRGESFSDWELRGRRKDTGQEWFYSFSGQPVRDERGNQILAVIITRDITARRRIEEQREDFLRALSHDIRNPLGIILGQAQMIQRLGDRTDLMRKSAQAIVTSARRIDLMIQDLVDSIRLESGQLRIEKRAVDVRSLVVDLLERAKVSMDIGRVRLQIPADLPKVYVDPDRIERVLTNLISNALKYSAAETDVLINAKLSDKEVLISVTDRGVGIGSEDLPHILERFYQPKVCPAARGLGLGLYITKMLVEAHGGRIWAESEVGKGSTFYCTLPAA